MTPDKNISPRNYPVALTVAGSDSGGGAGIEADLRTFNAFAVFGTAAITALTSQNPNVVRRIDAIAPEGVKSQIETVIEAIDVSYAKSGMLFNSAIVHAVAEAFKRCQIPLVVDPVMVATSKAKLLEDDAISAIQNELFPLAKWITPNIPEAELLLRMSIKNEDDLFKAATLLHDRYGCSVVVKGGHFESEYAIDAAIWSGNLYKLSSPRLTQCRHSHGTGCTFSAALCALLACQETPAQALKGAKAFVLGSLCEPIKIGPDVEAMYPPELDYSSEVELTKI